MSGPFDYVRSINQKISVNADFEKDYVPYIINRAMSYYPDTVGIANFVNEGWELPKKIQYDLYYNVVRQKSRYTPWIKKEKSAAIEIIRQYYKYSYAKAKVAAALLTEEQVRILKKELQEGNIHDRSSEVDRDVRRGDP